MVKCTCLENRRSWVRAPLWPSSFEETKCFFTIHSYIHAILWGSPRDRVVACSVSDRQGANFESFVWGAVPSNSSHNPREIPLAQFSLYVHKCCLKPHSFHLQFVSNAHIILYVFFVSSPFTPTLIQYCGGAPVIEW